MLRVRPRRWYKGSNGDIRLVDVVGIDTVVYRPYSDRIDRVKQIVCPRSDFIGWVTEDITDK